VLDPKIHSNTLLNSILAKIEANVAGADDAVLLDGAGFVAETNATHLFFVLDGVLCTPTTRACPEGITRATVLRLAADAGIPTEVGDFPLTRLYSAAEAFVTGTMGELTPVLAVDGRRIGADGPGPLTEQLSAAYAELTRTSGTRVV
jgi:branched-chain amino acid aminotransferase